MRLGIPKETVSGERRVAVVPEAVASLVKAGMETVVETGAGQAAFFTDADYEKAGARIVPAALSDVDVVLKVQRPNDAEVSAIQEGAVFIGLLQPASSAELFQKFAARHITGFAMELLPRISRAQKMDVLSSQATVSGYKAALIAAEQLSKFFPMLMTAAGTISPAKVLVLGAGVAGLQAIATARRLGATVWGYDVRSAVKEQIESLGAKFLAFDIGDAEGTGGYAKELTPEQKQKQQQMLAEKMKEFDVVITTALIPGKPAPKLITKETVAGMRPGSVIVDLAAEAGGNCELTEPGQNVEKHGVMICGPLNLPSTTPTHASQMYARNVSELLKSIVKDGKLALDFSDEVVKAACVTHDGKVLYGAKS